MSQLRMIWHGEEPMSVKLKANCRIIDRTADGFTKDELADGWLYACAPLIDDTWNREKFFTQMWDDPAIPADGIFFAVTAEGKIFSTAAAQILPDGAGNLHMVGTNPECQGMGGGMAVSHAVVDYFYRRGIRKAYLRTDDFRLSAIKIYLALGYRPYLTEEDMPGRWCRIMENLSLKELTAYDGEDNPVILKA